MENSLDDFIRNIPNFFDLSVGDMIPYFVYYLCDGNNLSVTPKTVSYTHLADRVLYRIAGLLRESERGGKSGSDSQNPEASQIRGGGRAGTCGTDRA